MKKHKAFLNQEFIALQKRGFLIIFLILSLMLTEIFKLFPLFAEGYCQNIRPVIIKPITFIFSVFPFSVAEISVILTVVIIAFIIIKMIIKRQKALKYITNIAALTACLAFIFNVTYGSCYYRKSISEILGMYNFNHNVTDMENTVHILIDEMEDIRSRLKLNDEEIFTLDLDLDELSSLCSEAFIKAAEENEVFKGNYGCVKGVLLSKPWTYTFVMGMYFPFTGEANINTNIPHSLLPQTVLHEMSHQRGIAREEDADFAAFYVSRNADDRLKYSADIEALGDLLDCLYASDTEAFKRVSHSMSDGIKMDFNFNSRFWNEYATKVADVSSEINNAYLQSNGQQMGVVAYSYSAWLVMDYYALAEF